MAIAATAYALGAVLLAASWLGSSAATTLNQQIAWIGLGIGALLAASIGAAAWLLQGRRALARRRAAWIVQVRNRRTTHRRPREVGQLVAGPPMTRFHRSECPLVVGKPVVAGDRPSHERAGRRSCGVCRP